MWRKGKGFSLESEVYFNADLQHGYKPILFSKI